MERIQKILKPLVYLIVILLANSVIAKPLVSITEQFEQTLQEHKGQVLYIDFWASWCGPCRKSFPWMNTLQDKYGTSDFKIISINLDADQSLAKQFLVKSPANFMVIYDPLGELARQFNVQGMPSSLLLDKEGNIQNVHSGFYGAKTTQYEDEIYRLMKK